MLTPPDIPAKIIVAHMRDHYDLAIQQATFLPLGADAYAAVYQLDAEDGSAYFLKLKRGEFDEAGVAVPATLHEQGVAHVMAPLRTSAAQLWATGHGYRWILYPFLAGHNGFRASLTDAYWSAFGRTLRAVHDATLAPGVARLVQVEDYTSRWRDMVVEFTGRVEAGVYDNADAISARTAALWRTRRDDIQRLVMRAGELAIAARQQACPLSLCHTDLHPGNVLIGDDGEFAIVDWDAPLYAPRERDLMFFGGAGFSEAWDDPRRVALFYEGYGPVNPDLVVLAYYRYERIVADFATYGEQIFEERDSVEDREKGVRALHNQFLSYGVLDYADRTYQRLVETR
jgi:spectinomycin phosphotransferase